MYYYTEDDNRHFRAQIAAREIEDEKDREISALQEKLKTAKAEAIKEFAERLEPLKKFRSCMTTSEYELSVTMREVDAVKKELMKEKDGDNNGNTEN